MTGFRRNFGEKPTWGSSSFVVTGNDHSPRINLNEEQWWSWDIWNRMNFWAKANKTDPTLRGYARFESINREKGYYFDEWKTSLFDKPEGSTQDEFVRWNQLLFPGWYRLHYPEHFIGLYEDLYVAVGNNSYSHIEITNNKNYSQSTKSSLLTPLNWTHDKIIAEVNYGEFHEGEEVFLFVFTNEGLVNKQGFKMTLGESDSSNISDEINSTQQKSNDGDSGSSSSSGGSSSSDSSGSSGSSSSGSSGVGGSSSSRNSDSSNKESLESRSSDSDISSYVVPSCQSDFSYSSWSSCIDGTQFRIVNDQNSCVESTQETRVCETGADENEIKELNAKEIQLAKINNRRYETTFSDTYNEMVYTNEKLEDESFVVVDSTTKQQYLGTLVNEESGKYYYTLERVDQNNVDTLKEQGLAERSFTESMSTNLEKIKNSRNFVSMLVILSLFGITTVMYLVSRYIKNLHKKSSFE